MRPMSIIDPITPADPNRAAAETPEDATSPLDELVPPAGVPAPAWADNVEAWTWEPSTAVWTRRITRRVGGDVTAVLLDTIQDVRADGTVHTYPVDVVLPAGSIRDAVVGHEELGNLIDALATADLLLNPLPRGIKATPTLPAPAGAAS
jgi:hypothetical protein